MHLLQVVVEFGIVLGILVLVHEFGHFAMGKLCGVRIEAFALGFGTRLFGFKYGETDYRVNLLPLGGYVKFAGEMQPLPADMDPTEGMTDPGEFNAHPRWQRALIALAGPVANFILAFFILAVVAHFHHEVDQYLTGPAVLDYVPANTPAARAGLAPGDTLTRFNGRNNPNWLQVAEESALHMGASLPIAYIHDGQPRTSSLPIDTGDRSGEFTASTMDHIGLLPRQQAEPIGVQAVEPDTPAAAAGLQPGDQIERIDNLAPHSVQTLLAYLQDRNGAPARLLIDRHGQQVTVPIVPKRLAGGTGETQFRLGFRPTLPPTDVVKLPIGQAMKQSLKDNGEYSTLLLRVLKGMFTHQVAVKSVSGPVGMAQQIDMAVQYGKWALFQTVAAISLNLGILNLMPFPILDGGMILFLLVEAVMRRDVNQAIKERVYQVAFVCIVLFAALVMFNDIVKLHLKP
jgi:regulator of sigma E protease